MKVYLAGEGSQMAHVWDQYVPRRLMTYYYHGAQRDNLPSEEALAMQGKDLILDSGAFSAWVKQESLDVDRYIAYVQASGTLWSTVAALDVIGDAHATWANYERMCAAGLKTMPTFHYGEPWDMLDQIIGATDYIAFGGLVGKASVVRQAWLDEAWSRLCTPAGLPRVRVHGFGVTTLTLMTMYPWYSVDSTSWLQSAIYGMGMVLLHTGKLARVVFSEDNPAVREQGGWHYRVLSPPVKEAVDDALRTTYNVDPEECVTNYRARCIVNAITYRQYEARGITTFTQRQPTFAF